ncbi:hypothetical protein GGR52DRAFT_341954 [Hypoxylon sp. FL1284]|nr:hypothetical protein GGR52DRAFT_341954 [Hypoxylon sp. FL1284]
MHHQIFAASALLLGAATMVYAAPSGTTESALEARKTGPKCWYGTDFPADSDWLSFDELFSKWKSHFQAQGDSQHEIDVLKDSIKTYSAQGGFSPALTTAMMIHESDGNTARQCGDQGQSCGPLQVRGASNECAGKAHPCPDATIRKQIQCGTVGCGVEGNNIQQCASSQNRKWGEALRCYNTGSVRDPSNLRVAKPGESSYVQNVANILVGADYSKLNELGGQKCGF